MYCTEDGDSGGNDGEDIDFSVTFMNEFNRTNFVHTFRHTDILPPHFLSVRSPHCLTNLLPCHVPASVHTVA